MCRILAFLYGAVSYLVFFITFLYAVGFVSNLAVPKSIDSGTGDSSGQALIINLLLLSVFAMQHSVMARPAFKHWWTKFVPPAIERSTYVLLSSLALILLYWQWQPMDSVIWSIENTAGFYALWTLFWIGWTIVLVSTFLISHFDLFGLRQVYLYMKGKEYTHITFRAPFFYKFVRHPIMLGFIIAFWATPNMTLGHLVFSITTTIYILIALQFEEHDLTNHYGATYKEYQEQVSMIFPFPKKK